LVAQQGRSAKIVGGKLRDLSWEVHWDWVYSQRPWYAFWLKRVRVVRCVGYAIHLPLIVRFEEGERVETILKRIALLEDSAFAQRLELFLQVAQDLTVQIA
jgi:hypothetical protein